MKVYLDNNATTMTDPDVVRAMEPYWSQCYANPSSVHQAGQQARYAVEEARQGIRDLLGASGWRMIFTSGGTEANDLAIRGTLATRPTRRHLITTTVEHDSVLRLMNLLESEGYSVSYVGVDRQGRLDPAAVADAITDDTALISVMYANNETGVIFPIEQLAELAAARGVPMHVDAIQAIGKLPVELSKLKVQTASITAHKFHGPKGVGALLTAPRVRLRPRLVGGHQEHDIRAGTENVPAIVGMHRALQLACHDLAAESVRIAALRDRLEAGILQRISIARINGDPAQRICNTTNLGFERISADALLMLLSNQGVYASAGSACSSGSLEPSHVLTAMGVPDEFAHGSIRLSVSRFTTEPQIEHAIDIIAAAVTRLQTLQAGVQP